MSKHTYDVATKSLSKAIKGNYRKRKAMVVDHGEQPVTINQDPHWSGGSKEEYTFFALRGLDYVQIDRDQAGSTAPATREDGTPIVGLAGAFEDTTLHDHVICVITGHFCGKPALMKIHGTSRALTGINS
jgi:hypothetical protein